MRYWITAIVLAVAMSAPAAAVQIIVNQPTLAEGLSRADLRAIYSMKRQFWPDGTAITVVVLQPSDPLHKQFCKQKLQLLPFQLNRQWDRLVFSGMGERPQQAANAAELLRLVNATPGAIGYLPEQMEAQGLQLHVSF
ncbi:hypothetical protein [Ferrimonas senticii]|uniref:hypothetical protein n=1 Tax=Ferrimonas senticii TaxID=394566 RepID=UPI00040AE08B|nr:hypothetical protein [Ferrimonas senticii]